jgi:hypothetical protein
MTNNNFFRISGWCAVLVAMLLLAIHVVAPGTSSMAGLFLKLGILLGLTWVFYALYVAHRTESAGLSQAGLAFWLLALGMKLINLAGDQSTFPLYGEALFWLAPTLIFGILACRNSRMPRGLAVLAFLAVISFFITAVAGGLGIVMAAKAANVASDVFILVLLVWLGFVFVSEKFAAVSSVPVIA